VYRCFVIFRIWVHLIGVLLFLGSGIAEEDFRTWTSSDGKKMEAKYLRKIGEKIKIVTNRGKEYTVPLSRFSKEDQQYVLDTPIRDSFSLPEPFHDGKKGAVIIASVKGTVEVYNHLLDQKEPAKVGSVLTSPKTLITGNNGGSVIIFTNGTSANIGANTKLFFQKIWQQEFKAPPLKVSQIKEETSPCRIALELKSGDLVVDVKKLKNSSSFHIHSPVLAAGIRGTKFGFSATNDYSNLGVLEGEVVVLDTQRKVVGLKNKQKVDGTKTGASGVSAMTREQEASIRKSVDSIVSVTKEYKISQLEQVMLSHNKQAKVDKVENQNTDKIIEILEFHKKQRDSHIRLGQTSQWGMGIINDLSPLIKPLSELSDLRTLNLNNNQITDLSPLQDLQNKDQIEYLYLANNNISDLSPLKGFSRLHTLDLRNTQISDLTPLSELPLSYIILSGESGLDSRQILKFPKLTKLSLSRFSQLDLSFLSGLTNLELLNLSGCTITDTAPLNSLINLDTLYLSDNNFSDLSDLVGMRNLMVLSIRKHNIFDLTPITRLKTLRRIDLSGSSISNLTPLSQLPFLFWLSLKNVAIEDYSPLRALTNLKVLILSKNDATARELTLLKEALQTTTVTLE